MQLRKVPKSKISISALGFGCLRFPIKNEDQSNIEEERAIEMIRYAVDNGVNFVDTAYLYHGEMSEVVVGKALNGDYRNKVYLATKLPVAKMEEETDFDKFLDEQLQKLNTSCIDFYFLHALNPSTWDKTKKFDLLSKLDKAKLEGKIRYPAFSFHAGTKLFKEIIDSYDWHMSLVQFNYLDEYHQAGIEGIKYAADKGVAVAIMEPLRGGKLALNPPKEVSDILAKAPIRRTAADWGLRWVLNHPEVTTVLSGMSNLGQVKENIITANDAHPNSMSDDEIKVIEQIKDVYHSKLQIGCTDCRYCIPCTPRNIAIPAVFSLYNELYLFDANQKPKKTYQKIIEQKRDGNRCIRCGVCEHRCPQDLPIRDLLAKAHKELRN